MKANNDLKNERLFIEDGDTVYEFIEHDTDVLEVCEDWTDMDSRTI